ncbi:MAG: ABC transporter substrate-binding protein [Myxococcaceae bacterium]
MLLLALVLLQGCRSGERKLELVFVHQPLGEPTAFKKLLSEFPEGVTTQVLPASSDVAHQYFLTALEGGAADLDVFVIDVVWVAEFAKARWIEDLSDVFPPERVKSEFFTSVAQAVTYEGKVYAVPWYLDVGLLYYRRDLVPAPPRTYDELKRVARGRYVWQGRQYEGLVCNVYEAIWGHGGDAEAALTYLRSLLVEGVSPSSVTSFAEEDARQSFQNGNATLMRNWPYAWSEAEREDSPIRGKFGVTALPSLDGSPGPGALGGWQLAVRAGLPPERRRSAVALVKHLTSAKANLILAVEYGRNPPRPEVYESPQVPASIARLAPFVRNARPRPITPYYSMLSDVFQSEFSAAVVGVRSPEEALKYTRKREEALER